MIYGESNEERQRQIIFLKYTKVSIYLHWNAIKPFEFVVFVWECKVIKTVFNYL